MAKRQRGVSLSFVLLRFAIVMLVCMLLCGLTWMRLLMYLYGIDAAYRPSVSGQQVRRMLLGTPEVFVPPRGDFLPEYALFAPGGEMIQSNVEGRRLQALEALLQQAADQGYATRHTYADGSTVVLRWRYRAEFKDPVLRGMLPPFEYIWLGTLGAALLLCLLFSTLWLRKCLAGKLALFSAVSEKIGAQALDFSIPHAGIREYDQALDAMEHMREALQSALSAQWAAQQKREAEIAALAHDIKTPLTLIGGNAELLLEETLPEQQRKMVETIAASNERARRYVAGLLDAQEEEAFESYSLKDLFDELCQSVASLAHAGGVCLQTQNRLAGDACVQKERLLRALGNVALNAIEHTLRGASVHMQGCMTQDGWQITVADEGPGFTQAALRHATERLWRDDTARAADGHSGLGLWFAAQVVKAHAGELALHSGKTGGVVTIRFR